MRTARTLWELWTDRVFVTFSAEQRGVPPRREPAPYFVGLRCVFVCVHLRTYPVRTSLVRVGRPNILCVCRVGNHPARSHTVFTCSMDY